MTHNSSRKQFFAKLFGLAAVIGVLPKLLTKSQAATPVAPVENDAPAMPVTVRADPRAVARRAEVL